MDWASQHSRKMVPMSRPSDREKTAVRHPPAFAHAGEPSVTCLPVCWSRSDSRPSWWIGFDSGEPRWNSQTVPNTERKNCKYSDCQFSATSTANDDDVT